MDKAIEAVESALEAKFPGDTSRSKDGILVLDVEDYNTIDLSGIARAAIRAYLRALKEDTEVIQQIARAIGLSEGASFTVDDEPGDWGPQARAAIAALLGDAP